jgi:TPR repeat protein
MRKLISALLLVVALALPGIAAACDEHASADAALEAGDYAAALKLYHAAAVAGDVRAQEELGFMYWYGEEVYGPAVQSDPAAAFEWFARAAGQGSVIGSTMLAVLFKDESSTPVTQAVAVRSNMRPAAYTH